MKKLIFLILIFTTCSAPDFVGVNIYIKTKDNKEYFCENCTVDIYEYFYWEDDIISFTKYSKDDKIFQETKIEKSEIITLKIDRSNK